jgi:DNA-binding transcriptional LysR family regulator
MFILSCYMGLTMSRQFDALMLGSIEIFCLSAETGSFTRAAQLAGVTPAAVSRAIARLEARMAVRLFTRTTRKVNLTDAGKRYFEQCKQALGQLADAEREISGHQNVPTGKVRLSVPTPVGHYRILPLLSRFRQLYPEVEIEVHISNRNIDFASEGFDLAVRGRIPPDSGLIARKLLDIPLVVVATPAYLRRCGVPDSLEDLRQHECIQFALPSTGVRIPWLFRQDGKDIEVETSGGIQCSEDILGTLTLARHGAGLIQTMRAFIEDDLARGTLVEVLQDYAGRTRLFSLLYPSARHLPQRVKLLIDFLLAEIKP